MAEIEFSEEYVSGMTDPFSTIERLAPLSPREEIQQHVLAGLITAPSVESAENRYQFARENVREEYFENHTYRSIFHTLCNWYALYQGVPEEADFFRIVDLSRNTAAPLQLLYKDTYHELKQIVVPNARFRHVCTALSEYWREEELAKALSIANIIQAGSYKIDKEVREGYEDAVEYLRGEMSRIEIVRGAKQKGGYLNEMGDELFRDYMRSTQGTSQGVLTGFPRLDQHTGGIGPGEMWLVAGYSNSGKSKTCFNMAYHAAFVQKKNVMLATIEDAERFILIDLIALHSRQPQFDYPQGLDTKSIATGRLDARAVEVFQQVLGDLSRTDYGQFFLYNINEGADLAAIESQFNKLLRNHPVDLVVINYLGALRSDRKRSQLHEEQNDLVLNAKRFAMQANDGKGVALLTPWQVNQDSYERALTNGSYSRTSLANTAQAFRSADLVMSILQDADRAGIIKAQILKYRTGANELEWFLQQNFATGYINDLRFGSASDDWGIDLS